MYRPGSEIQLEVMLGDDTVWLTVPQIAELFGRDVSTIRRHIYNLKEEELAGISIRAKFALTAEDGKALILCDVKGAQCEIKRCAFGAG